MSDDAPKHVHWIAVLFGVTFLVLLGLIVAVVATGQIQSMMALSGIAYALAAIGFLGVLAWAYARGQFLDYEDIKDEIFDLEARQ